MHERLIDKIVFFRAAVAAGPNLPPTSGCLGMNVLAINTGSSSVKFTLIESDREQVLVEGMADGSVQRAGRKVQRAGQPPTATRSSVGGGLGGSGHRELSERVP